MERELSSGDVSEPVEIELADISAILQLNGSQMVAQQARTARPLAVSRNRTRRCKCGVCRTCLENARWESVFQKKFADPYYYSLREPKQGSSLSGF
ncbi:MAG: hypothetical protein WDO73_37390 [Ignavibacteriota bacterium]